MANPAELDKLKLRIQALRAKTIANGCTEDEALSAAAKVAELLDRHDLSLSDVELRASPCERRVFETHRKKRIPLEDCIGAIAHFCDCRVWREKNAAGESSYVFFGLGADVEVAHYLAELIDGAVRAGRSALEALGLHPYDAELQVRGFVANDQKAMLNLAEVYKIDVPAHENEDYVKRTREYIDQQERAMQLGSKAFSSRLERGWAPPTIDDVRAAEAGGSEKDR